jgi:hypothetical protein
MVDTNEIVFIVLTVATAVMGAALDNDFWGCLAVIGDADVISATWFSGRLLIGFAFKNVIDCLNNVIEFRELFNGELGFLHKFTCVHGFNEMSNFQFFIELQLDLLSHVDPICHAAIHFNVQPLLNQHLLFFSPLVSYCIKG